MRFNWLALLVSMVVVGCDSSMTSPDVVAPDVGPSCPASTVTCDDAGLQIKICNEDNTTFTLVPCAASEYCQSGECLPQVCVPNAMECFGRRTQLCNANGSGYVGESGTNCEAANMWCRGGECVRALCEPDCGASEYCSSEGECLERVCEPNERSCSTTNEARLCDTIGSGFVETVNCSDSGMVCVDGECAETGCGNGVLEDGESCDDGNLIATDGCTNECAPAACGDGVRRLDLDADDPAYEECDDGNPVQTDSCLQGCVAARCGDTIVRTDLAVGEEGHEACDDGDDNESDGCRRCQLPGCGDGIRDRDLGEACDDGNLEAGDGCDPQCENEGVVNVGLGQNNEALPAPEENDGLELDDDGNLRLNGQGARLTYLWVANSTEGTISKVDTQELREVARYDSVGPNDDGLTPGTRSTPSRTGIDLNGDMFVANRMLSGGQPSVTKIYNSDCQDRNGDGIIQTSSDVNGNNIIDRNDPNEFFGQNDECFAWTKAVGRSGGIGRSLAIDLGDRANPHGNVWVGMYSHREFYGIQGSTGELIVREGLQNPVAVGHAPYGAIVDSNGYVWSGTLTAGTIVGFDSTTGRASGLIVPQGVPARSYGFTMDGENRLWVGAQQEGVNRYDPYHDANGNPIQDPLAGGGAWRHATCGGHPCYMRGANADGEGRIWFADNTQGVIGYDVDTMALIGPYSVGGRTTGAGVDFNGMIWAIASAGYAGRIDPANPSDPANPERYDRVTVGSGPYTYSDFTGFGLRNFTRRGGQGSYTVRVPGCDNGPTNWLSLAIEATVPENTAVNVTALVAETEEMLEAEQGVTAGPFTLAPGQDPFPVDIEALPSHRYMSLSFALQGREEATPLLRSFNVAFQCLP